MGRPDCSRWLGLLAASSLVAALGGCGRDTGVVVLTYLQGQFPLDSVDYQVYDPADQAADGSVGPVATTKESLVGRDLSADPFRFLILRNGALPDRVRVQAYAYAAQDAGNERPVAFGWDTFSFLDGELVAYRLDLWPSDFWGGGLQPSFKPVPSP